MLTKRGFKAIFVFLFVVFFSFVLWGFSDDFSVDDLWRWIIVDLNVGKESAEVVVQNPDTSDLVAVNLRLYKCRIVIESCLDEDGVFMKLIEDKYIVLQEDEGLDEMKVFLDRARKMARGSAIGERFALEEKMRGYLKCR